jgi:hypothetical protein
MWVRAGEKLRIGRLRFSFSFSFSKPHFTSEFFCCVHISGVLGEEHVCVCVCVCVRARVRACVRVIHTNTFSVSIFPVHVCCGVLGEEYVCVCVCMEEYVCVCVCVFVVM